MSKKQSICAVVVTYNRKLLLLNCLNALRTQSYHLDHIVVVNNASTDGTIDFLRENGYSDNEQFTLINLSENQGGAGGFYAGIEFVQSRFDYIWLMDDDGLPTNNTLLNLVPYLNHDVYIGPLVLNSANPNELTFTLRLPNSQRVLATLEDVKTATIDGVIPDIVMPFNGILFSSQLVEKIGLPKKEYFIWGDDIEYTWRAKKFGYRIFTVVDAEFLHPKEATLGTPMLFNLMKFNDTESKLKLYCMCRNNFKNMLTYKNKAITLLFVVKLCWFYLFTKPNLSKLKLGLTGILHSLKGNFSQHKNYL